MSRTPSPLATTSFNALLGLQTLSTQSSFPVRLLSRVALRFVRPLAKKLGANHTVISKVYGLAMTMPSEHPLPGILTSFPQYNRPLAQAVEAIAKAGERGAPVTVIDIGANIGDTVAVIEQGTPNICNYLCIEPDREMARICRSNFSTNSRVRVEQSFIGEAEGSTVRLEDDGRANPSTKRTDEVEKDNSEVTFGTLVRLDTLAVPFAQTHGAASLVKVDTEGYDFSVLRSGPVLLSQYKPCIFLEWYPALLEQLHEEPWSGFEYLQSLDYQHFVFFTNQGDFYCEISNPDRLFLRSLIGITRSNRSLPYFDVFASTSRPIRDALVEICMPAGVKAQ